jgi:hypothetical protein
MHLSEDITVASYAVDLNGGEVLEGIADIRAGYSFVMRHGLAERAPTLSFPVYGKSAPAIKIEVSPPAVWGGLLLANDRSPHHEKQIVNRSLSHIFRYDLYIRPLSLATIHKFGSDDDIGAQRAVLLILRDHRLPSGISGGQTSSYQGEGENRQGGPVMGVVAMFLAVILIGWGAFHIVILMKDGRFLRHYLFGVGLVISGWGVIGLGLWTMIAG